MYKNQMWNANFIRAYSIVQKLYKNDPQADVCLNQLDADSEIVKSMQQILQIDIEKLEEQKKSLLNDFTRAYAAIRSKKTSQINSDKMTCYINIYSQQHEIQSKTNPSYLIALDEGKQYLINLALTYQQANEKKASIEATANKVVKTLGEIALQKTDQHIAKP